MFNPWPAAVNFAEKFYLKLAEPFSVCCLAKKSQNCHKYWLQAEYYASFVAHANLQLLKVGIHISFHEGPRDKKLFWWKYRWVLLRFSMEFPHPRYMILLHFSCSFISSALKMNLIWLFGHDILNNNAQFHEKTTRHHNLWVKLSTHWRQLFCGQESSSVDNIKTSSNLKV